MNPAHPMRSSSAAAPFGEHLRHWRQRRRMSQLDLSSEAEISTRHLSFVETGRATPSREMALRLFDRLDVPLRERNAMLMAAGYAPMYRERPLDDPALAAARRAVQSVLKGHEPFPALAVDRHWNMVASNRAVAHLLASVDEALLVPPVNVLRLSLHPAGLAPRIANLNQWRTHLFARLRQQVHSSGDIGLRDLLDELLRIAPPAVADTVQLDGELAGVVVPLRLATPTGVLSFISTTTVFGSPVDVTLQEIAIESFFPADDMTAQALRALV